MLKKIVALILIFIFSIFTLTGCYDIQHLEELSYAIAIGIDKGDNNLLKLTIQFAIPDSPSENGSSSQSKNSTYTTIECTSIDTGINLINSHISNVIEFSHCKVIVFSEEIATEGISDYIYTLQNYANIRPNCSIIISRCNATDFISSAEPQLVKLTARYYEIALNSSDYTGFSDDIKLSTFHSDLKDSFCQPVAILGGINTSSTHTTDVSDNYIDLDSSYKADQTPIEHKNVIENMGLAVFNKGILVGELNGIECLCYLILTNNFKRTTILIKDPFSENNYISLILKPGKKTKTNVKLVNGSRLYFY